jgi:hypothetical protein
MVAVKLDRETIARIDELRFVIGKETGFDYDREEIINMALTAFNDVREG